MIPTIAGWTTEAIPQGIVMLHPGGKQIATIAYRERVRPLRRLGAIVDEILRRAPHWKTETVGVAERLQTYDGEHAALITVLGSDAGRPAQRDLGVVFADDFYSSVGALCLAEAFRPEITSVVRELTRADTHALGVRRRRFEYGPPAGWQPLPMTGFAVQWLAPEFGRDGTKITVYAACPHQIVEGASFDAIESYLGESGQALRSRKTIEQLEVQGLTGSSEELRTTLGDGSPTTRRVILLRDARYLYPVEMVTSLDLPADHEHLQTLQRLVQSIRPVPPPTRGEAIGGLVHHWLD